MRGPFERLKYDMRRVWECPSCNRRVYSGGDVTSRVCECQEAIPIRSRQSMRMLAEGGRRTGLGEIVVDRSQPLVERRKPESDLPTNCSELDTSAEDGTAVKDGSIES